MAWGSAPPSVAIVIIIIELVKMMHEICEELVQNLKEYAEWARANEYEVPLMLADDLELAADIIEGEFL